MTSEGFWRLGHRPSLDGLRGIAVALVVTSHAVRAPTVSAGSVGVTVFFTLSGFLITSQLLEERADRGRIAFLKFYERRALRLLPALSALVLTATVLGLLISPRIATVRSALTTLAYLGNVGPASGQPLDAFGHTWSLAIEEHFYLAWPVLLLALTSRRRVLIFATCAAAAGALERAALWFAGLSPERVYYGTDTRCDALLVGCALAASLQGRTIRPSPRHYAVVPLLVAVVAFGVTPLDASSYVLMPTVVPVLTAAVIYCLVAGEEPSWITARYLTLLGGRSYGLYLWHAPIFFFGSALLDLPRTVAVPVLAATSLLMTAVSWRYVEEPFLRIKRRRSASGAIGPAPSPSAQAVGHLTGTGPSTRAQPAG